MWNVDNQEDSLFIALHKIIQSRQLQRETKHSFCCNNFSFSRLPFQGHFVCLMKNFFMLCFCLMRRWMSFSSLTCFCFVSIGWRMFDSASTCKRNKEVKVSINFVNFTFRFLSVLSLPKMTAFRSHLFYLVGNIFANSSILAVSKIENLLIWFYCFAWLRRIKRILNSFLGFILT